MKVKEIKIDMMSEKSDDRAKNDDEHMQSPQNRLLQSQSKLKMVDKTIVNDEADK